MSGRDANLIVSVRSPVGTGVPKTGQWITISHITFEPSGSGQERKKAPAINGQGKLAEGGEKLEFSPTPSASLESRTFVSRSDPVPGLVRSRQRFVRRSQLLDHGNANHRRTKSAANDFNQINLWAGSSGDLLPPSPPAEKATARQDQAGQASTGDGARNANGRE